MALVNPNIAMSFRQPEFRPRNALAEYAQVQQIVGGQRQAEMADMQMEELRRKERAISQIQAAAVKHGGPTNRREIAQAYIKSGVPEFMKIGLTMDQDLDELEAFDRIMGGGAGGAARAAPSAAAAAPANAMAAPAAAPAGQLVAAPMPRPTGTVRDVAPGGAVGPETSIAQNLSSFRNTPPTGTKDIFGGQLSQEDKQRIEQYPGIKDLYETYSTNAAFFLNTPPDDYYYRNNVHLLAEQAKKLSDLTGVKVPGTVEELRQVLNIGQPAAQPPATANALAPAAAPVTNAMIAPAAQPAVPPAGLNQLAAAGAAPAGTAQTDPVAELRAKRDAFIRRGTARALQAARSLDADIALLSRTTSVAPGSTVIGPDGRLVYQAAAAPTAPRIDVIGVAEGTRTPVYFDKDTRAQFTIGTDPSGKQIQVPYTGGVNRATSSVTATATSMGGRLEGAEQKGKGEFNIKEYGEIATAARLAAKTLPALETQSKILDQGFTTGFGTDVKTAGASVLASLGVKNAEKFATNSQTFLAATQQAVLQKQLEQKGTQTAADAERITQTAAQRGNTVDANRFLIDVAKAQLKRDIEQREFYDNWWADKKTYEGVERAWYAGEGGKSLFDRPELKKYLTPSAAEVDKRTRGLDNIFNPQQQRRQ